MKKIGVQKCFQDYPADVERGDNLGNDVLDDYGLDPARPDPARRQCRRADKHQLNNANKKRRVEHFRQCRHRDDEPFHQVGSCRRNHLDKR